MSVQPGAVFSSDEEGFRRSPCYLFVTNLKLQADRGPSVLGAALQSVLFVAAQYVLKQIIDKVQPSNQGETTVRMTGNLQRITHNTSLLHANSLIIVILMWLR